MDNELLRLEYVPLATVALWDRNPKRHDVGGIIESIERYGFKDPPKFEPALNDGEGGIVEGNGRTVVLRMMQADYEKEGKEPPRGIALSDGDWAVPVLFGVDAASQGAAEAYAIDHNNLTMAGGDFDGFEMARLWDRTYVDIASELDELPVTLDADTLSILISNPDILSQVDAERQELYTRKIKAPIYEPSDIKPEAGELYDDSRTKQLFDAIEEADWLTDSEQEFLIIAARRHTVLHYNLIADFYAHADKRTQALMEDSALVIIDFGKALELGYVRLAEDVAEQYKADHG